ncbi:MAG: hypothetical protein HYS13_24470 [Planctomycetia bacterium]|nr:hypothetical protein [Planctomycetia bacterium]
MLEFPYASLPGGIARPILAVVLEGPTGRRLLDGLLDSGSDRTLFPESEARAVGLRLRARPDGSIRTAGGVSIPYRLADAVLELRASSTVLRWRTSIAFAPDPLQIIHLGYRGFLQFFHCTFQGPEKKILLDPRPALSRV